MILIGVIGRKNAGKDTLADLLVARRGFRKHALAYPLKEACRILFLLDDSQLNDPLQKEIVDARWGLSPRVMFQKIGTDFARETFGHDFWVRHLEYWVEQETPSRLVVPDIRFPNEAAWIRAQGGLLVRVRSTDPVSEDAHISETGVDEIPADIEIVNDKTLGLDLFHETVLTLLDPHLTSES